MGDTAQQHTTPILHRDSSPIAALQRGREAFARRAWREAVAQLSLAERTTGLSAIDLARLASSAHLIGDATASAAAWERAHLAALDAGDVPGAARAGFWVAFGLVVRREQAHAAGWIVRASRLLDDAGHDCVERGYLRFTEALQHATQGHALTAGELFAEAARIGTRFDDRSLMALARHAQGRAMIFAGDVHHGASLLDEALVAIESGEVAPVFVGDIYCSAISACHEMYDIARADEWTEALNRWCESQPDAIPYRGTCLVHRAEIIRRNGDWDAAVSEIERVREWFEQTPAPFGSGSAWYQIGEIHRLRGDFDAADQAFRSAARAGNDPQPGLALLRMAQGRTASGRAIIRRALDEANVWPRRARLLPACVEIALASDDLEFARTAATELTEIAERVRTPLLSAMAACAAAAIALADGDGRTALTNVRPAAAMWQALRSPYDVARARVLIGLACRSLGDTEMAELELDSARDAFESLGARPDVARVKSLLRQSGTASADRLTSREVEVLRLIATGRTNRAIASTLRISEKTVARHVSNIFTKLQLPNRAAATSYAHEHGLVGRST